MNADQKAALRDWAMERLDAAQDTGFGVDEEALAQGRLLTQVLDDLERLEEKVGRYAKDAERLEARLWQIVADYTEGAYSAHHAMGHIKQMLVEDRRARAAMEGSR